LILRPASFVAALGTLIAGALAAPAFADEPVAAAAKAGCPVNYQQLTQALESSVKPSGGPTNGGLDFNMWASVVTRDGFVCQVTFSGGDRNAQWPGSRLIAAQKAYAANAFSLDSFALSTANLYGTTQPGGSLWGLQFSNLLSTPTAYQGNPSAYGTANDPLDGGKVGGLIVFGGGLALYDKGKHIVGALGVSGDTSCADHNVAWRVRKALGLDNVPAGVAAGTDGILYSKTPTGFQHPFCGNKEPQVARQIGATPK
jgi:uncharacterized protein GlcG (DUF336 family)